MLHFSAMTQQHNAQPIRTERNGRLLSRAMLRTMVPVSDMTIWRWERDGKFPRHLAIYGRNYWLASEVEDWVFCQREHAGVVVTKEEAAK